MTSQAEKSPLKTPSPASPQAKIQNLRELEVRTERSGAIVSLVVGIIGMLALSTGVCYTVLWLDYFVMGVAVGIIGLITCAMAYPVYRKITAKKKAEIALEILKLSEEVETDI